MKRFDRGMRYVLRNEYCAVFVLSIRISYSEHSLLLSKRPYAVELTCEARPVTSLSSRFCPV